jgi:cation:H+ antiporter
MLHQVVLLLVSLGIILLGCELFTNGIEWLGKVLKVGDGVVGSIFSAVGTCLPETMIPLIALLFSGGGQQAADIGVGAILGAPFMLGTLAFFITGASTLVFWKKRRSGITLKVNSSILSRDIAFFIIVYLIGCAASFIDQGYLKYAIAMLLPCCYVYYIYLTVKNDHASHGKLEPLYFKTLLNLPGSTLPLLLQISLALGAIILGAEIFVKNIESIAETLNISALVLSLIIAPIATELPEKFNSILWISRGKDTLALGNITGAMVFQSCIPVAIGIVCTPWKLEPLVLLSILLALSSAMVTFLWLKARRRLSPIPLLTGGLFYGVFIFFLRVKGM